MSPNSFADYFSEIEALSLGTPHEEVVGFLLNDGVGSLAVYPTRNCFEGDRSEHFEVNVRDQLELYKSGRVFGLYHSHVKNNTEAFSEEDMRVSTIAGLPYMVYSTFTRKFNFFRPDARIPAYEGRPFILGVQDCVTLVCDFLMREFKVQIPFFARRPASLLIGVPDLAAVLAAHGFRAVDPESMRKGDVILMSLVNKGAVNHAGIFMGDGIVLHQLINRESAFNAYGDSLKRATKAVMRPAL